ncbi:MAG TPA: bifunctional diguanylate cyclase/phosphodiesterase [Candidatus Elarobacter sp.]|nr:bifunctional diguanylate cyclase/phosphodiesterase [Candidatus Elarobacter sp.]
MTTGRLANAFSTVVRTPFTRATSHAARADVFNRLYVVVMFAVIVAIGSFGIFALARSQQSGSIVSNSFEHAADTSEMGTALDREYAELLLQVRLQRATPSAAFVQATRTFEAVEGEVTADGWAAREPVIETLMPRHAAFVADSRSISDALAAGDPTWAQNVATEMVRPNVSAIQRGLDILSAVSFKAGVAEEAKAQRFSRLLQQLIAAVTVIGLALMAGFAVLLRRYKRWADAASAATLAALEQAALTDNLTKLGNNRSFYDDFEREIARAKRHDHSLVLALIDVDDFKAVNDKGGHSHGDAVLARVGDRLRRMRQEDRGYRIGGDEFALLLVETNPDAAVIALGRLQAEIRDSGLGATVSIGYVNLAGEQLDAESYELADTALYEAKRCGRNQTVCFENISGTVNVFSPRKADVVRKMIAQELVSTAFQPIWDVQSTLPLGFEALARPSAELGLAGPQEAFDVAQRLRQLPELDELCTRKALEAAVNLPQGSVIFINYSPASLAHAEFDPRAFVDTVRAAGLLPEQIVIELTERRIDDPSMVAKRAAALRALGIRIALDDTGSGHAGLEILSKVRFDFVKIDRLLVVEAMKNQEARGVLAGIIAIARETRSYLIAEGIETTEMLDFVRDAHTPKGADFGTVRGIQGYLLGRPELGRIDHELLDPHHAFLAARQVEGQSTPRSLDVLRGEESARPRRAEVASQARG